MCIESDAKNAFCFTVPLPRVRIELTQTVYGVTKHHLSQSYCNMCIAFHNVWTLIAGFDVNQMTKCETASESTETHTTIHNGKIGKVQAH